jgi:hypothetical protein
LIDREGQGGLTQRRIVEEAATWTEAEREKKELRQEEKIVGKRGKMVIEACSGYHEECVGGGESDQRYLHAHM